MDYYKIKADAEAIRDEAGLPAQYYPIFITIQDEQILGTGLYGSGPVEYGPHLRISLGREYIQGALQDEPEAFGSFRVRVAEEAQRAKHEARRRDVGARWAARRLGRQ